MVAVPVPKSRPANLMQRETRDQRDRRRAIQNVEQQLKGRVLLGSELTAAGLAERRSETLDALKGTAVGIPAGLLGLPADLLALLMRDAPQAAAQLASGKSIDELKIEDRTLVDKAVSKFQEYAGAEAIAGYMGFGDELSEDPAEFESSTLGMNPFRQGMLAGEIIADPVLAYKLLTKFKGLGPSARESQAVMEAAPRTPDLAPVQPSGITMGAPLDLPNELPLPNQADLPNQVDLPVQLPDNAQDLTNQFEDLMGDVARQELDEAEGIATLPAAEDVIDVEPVVQAALTPIRTEGQQVLRQQAFPITEDRAALPNAPVTPSIIQGEIIDYSPVYRQLSLLDDDQTYTGSGLASLLRALPDEAKKDLNNLIVIDDPDVLELTEDTYNQYLRAKNQDKSFDAFKAERNGTDRPAPDFIKVKQQDGETVFAKEIKKSRDPDKPRQNIQKIPQSGIINLLERFGDTPLRKDQVLKIFERSQPQVAVKSISTGEARAVLSGSDTSSGIPFTAAETVGRIGNAQNVFNGGAVGNPTVMVFNNPTTGTLFGEGLPGVPTHDYFSDSIPGYFGHVRYDDIELDTGERVAGFVEAQSNLQNAQRKTGSDFEILEKQARDGTDREMAFPELMFFAKDVESKLPEFTDLRKAEKESIEARSAARKIEKDNPGSSIREELIKETDNQSNNSTFADRVLGQREGEFGSQGSRLKVMSDAANDIVRIHNDNFGGDFIPGEFVSIARSNNLEGDVEQIFSSVVDDFHTRNGLEQSTAEYQARGIGRTELDEGLGLDSNLGDAVYFLAAAKSDRFAPLDVRSSQIVRFKEPDFTGQNLGSRVTSSSTVIPFESQTILGLLGLRPGINADRLVEFFSGTGRFEGDGPITYNNLVAEFGSEEMADAVLLTANNIQTMRQSKILKQKLQIEEVLSKPAALEEIDQLPQNYTIQDIVGIFERNATDEQLTSGGFSDIDISEARTPTNYTMNDIAAAKVLTVRDLPSMSRDEILLTVPGAGSVDISEARKLAPVGAAKLREETAFSNYYDAMQRIFPDDVAASRRVSDKSDTDYFDMRSFMKGDAFDLAKEKIQKLIDEGDVLVPEEFDSDELTELVANHAMPSGEFTDERTKILNSTPFSNATQMTQHMYRSFIQEAVEKQYDGVFFPNAQSQARAHSLSPDVAEQVYEQQLKNAIDVIRKDYPEFPSYEDSADTISYAMSGGGFSDGRGVYIPITPEIRAMFENRVIRRAKGGPVDLRPKKMIHSGIGAMAREMM